MAPSLLPISAMGSLISLTLWRSVNGVRCELVEQQSRRAFEVRLVRHMEVLNSQLVPDTDSAYRVATLWRSAHRVPTPDGVQPPRAA